ncbi:hypothetical protein BVRB_6g146740 [Beta vulgaris subsp. vulgaris]|nr:hypothetical protein BVRB_6g146740 [Beta vulgaris subsp. vulgaris]
MSVFTYVVINPNITLGENHFLQLSGTSRATGTASLLM